MTLSELLHVQETDQPFRPVNGRHKSPDGLRKRNFGSDPVAFLTGLSMK
jgi:hypothetical protein